MNWRRERFGACTPEMKGGSVFFSPRPWHQKWSGKGAGFVAALPHVSGTSTP